MEKEIDESSSMDLAPPAIDSACAKLLTKACLDAFTLYEEQKGLEQVENMKKEIAKNNLSTEACPDLDENFLKSVEEKTKAISLLQSRIKEFESKFVQKAVNRLYNSLDFDSNLNSDAMSMLGREFSTYIEPYTQHFEQLNQRLAELERSLIDKNQLSNFYKNIEESREYFDHRPTELLEGIDFDAKVKSQIMELWLTTLKSINSETYKRELKENVERKLLGYSSLAEEKKEIAQMELSKTVQRSVSDFLRDEFMNQLFPNTIYPKQASPVKKRVIDPEEIDRKLRKIEDFTIKKTSLASSNLCGKGIKKAYVNIGRYYDITRNHEDILNFLNGPNGETHNNFEQIPEDLQPYMSPQCNMYERDSRLSSALATSIVQYTETSFSDMQRRINELEKKVNNMQ